MKIASSSLFFTSSREAYTRQETQESMRFWRGDAQAAQPEVSTRNNRLFAGTAVTLSAEARGLATNVPTTVANDKTASAVDSALEAAEKDPLLRMIRTMVEMMTGEPIRVFSAKDMPARGGSGATSGATSGAASGSGAAAPQASLGDGGGAARALLAGAGFAYDYRSVREEFEQTSVTAKGVIRTADGKEINFQLDLTMQRQYREETSFSVRSGAAVRKDPLVLNFDGNAAQLTNQYFRFDLDGDGKKEDLAMLAAGSGYLALDLDGNGKIDSGRELFGPETNSGFGELAALDSDGNGWIDENDAAYDALRIWTPNPDGTGKLETLRERKVGAIAVDSIASPFELRGSGNTNLGAVAATGVFLTEDGRVGSVQEIDLTVRSRR